MSFLLRREGTHTWQGLRFSFLPLYFLPGIGVTSISITVSKAFKTKPARSSGSHFLSTSAFLIAVTNIRQEAIKGKKNLCRLSSYRVRGSWLRMQGSRSVSRIATGALESKNRDPTETGVRGDLKAFLTHFLSNENSPTKPFTTQNSLLKINK